MSLQQLQEIRERRLEKQRKKLLQHQTKVNSAQQKLQQSQQKLTQFHQWRLQQQEDLFKSLQGQACSPQGMMDYRAKIEKLSEEEEQLKALILSAEEELKTAQASYAEVKKITSQLALKNEKTKEIITIRETQEKHESVAQD